MILWYGALAIVYAIYHLVFFSFSTQIFNYSGNKLAWGSITYVVNLAYWLAYIHWFSAIYEAVAATLFIVLLLVEFLLIFRLKFQLALYIALTFALNLLAKRLALLGGIALFFGGTVAEVMADPVLRLAVMLLACGMSVNTIALARKSLSKIYLDTILSDAKNIKFLTSVFFIINITIITIAATMYIPDGGTGLLMFYTISGLGFILAFLVFMVYAYQLANLHLVAETARMTEAQNEEQKRLLVQLVHESERDVMTGMLDRDRIEEIIHTKIQRRENFFLAFLDIDGLKYANDNYGHSEGDFYIHAVSETVREWFPGDSVARYGGDEILVVGKFQDELEVSAKVVHCYTAVEQIAVQHHKAYTTSISYGIVFSNGNPNITPKQIIALGDQRMYEMKKLRQKQRKAVAPKRK